MATYKPSRSQHYLGWDWLYLLLEMLEVIGHAGLVRRHPFFLLMLSRIFSVDFFLLACLSRASLLIHVEPITL